MAVLAVLSLSSAAPAWATGISVLYVATNGDDLFCNGLYPSGTAPNCPLKTLLGARDKLRDLRQYNQLDPNTTTHVKILAGVYRMSDALILQAGDSGTPAAPVSFEAYSTGSKPVFTGGQPVTTGTTCPTGGFCVNNSTGVWELTRPEFQTGNAQEWQIEQLLVNGRRATRARTPNRDTFSESVPAKGYIQRTKIGGIGLGSIPPECFDSPGAPLPVDWANEPVSRACFKLANDADFAKLSALTTAQLHDVQLTHLDYWTISKSWIDKLDLPTKTIVLAGRLPWGALPPKEDSRIEFSGIPSALDAPGEFYIDRRVGTLRYFPFPGEDPTTAVVEAPRMSASEIIDIQATSPDWVHDLSFHNLIFEESAYLLRRTWNDADKFTGGYVDSYGGFSLPAAITVERGSHLDFDGLEVRHTGAFAFWLRHDSEYVTIENSYLHELGGGGIKVVEYDPNLQGVPYTNFGYQVEMGGHHVIRNNVVHSGGRSFYDTNGILVVMSANNDVSHNEVGDFFNSGISTFAVQPGVSVDNSVTQNRIHQIGQDLMSDIGAFYSGGYHTGQVITNNQLFNVRHFGVYGVGVGIPGYGAIGAYMDGESQGTLHDNLAYDVESSGLFLNKSGSFREVTNNVFAISEERNLSIANNPDYISGEAGTVEHNVFYSQAGTVGYVSEGDPENDPPCPPVWNPDAYEIDYNLYWGGAPGSAPVTFTHQCDYAHPWSWAQWQAMGIGGTDPHSIAGSDPGFANPANWDFTLSPSNPALQAIGFVPFSVAATGVDATTPFYAQRDELERPLVDFGGMYGLKYNGIYGNPLYKGKVAGVVTENAACPQGYTDTRIHGALGVDWYLDFCHRPLSDQPSLSEFGGMYVGVNGPNALTGGNGCPAGFQSNQILGDTSPSDPSVFFCYEAPASATPQWQFGGMFGNATAVDVVGGVYLNPLDGRRAACPAGYTQYTLIPPTPNVDFGLYYCGKHT